MENLVILFWNSRGETKRTGEDPNTNLLARTEIRIMGFLNMEKELLLLDSYICFQITVTDSSSSKRYNNTFIGEMNSILLRRRKASASIRPLCHP